MLHPDSCGSYHHPNSNYTIVKTNNEGDVIAVKRVLADTKIADENEFKFFTRISRSKSDPNFRKRVIKVLEHPAKFEEFKLRDKAVVEYVGKVT